MIFSDVQKEQVFIFEGDKRPFLKIEEGKSIDLFTREEKEVEGSTEIVPVSIDLLTLIMHREEVKSWVEQAIAFYVPKEDEGEKDS